MSVRTTLGLDPLVVPARPTAGRSLWSDAFARLRRNRAAVLSAFFLLLMAFACVAGPAIAPHAYDDVFEDYTKVGPSLAAYPWADSHVLELRDALGRAELTGYTFVAPVEEAPQPFVIGQARPATIGVATIAVTQAGGVSAELADAISALPSFDNAVIAERSPDGLSATVTADVATGDVFYQSIDRALRRARVTLSSYVVDEAQQRIVVEVTATRNIDPRIGTYFDRSDVYENALLVTMAEDSRSATVSADVTSELFLFGTDTNGRDLLSRILVGGRISFTIGILATAVALIVGVAYGAIAGYAGGRADLLMMRIVDILYSLPFIFFVILLIVFFGRNWILMFVAVGAIEWLDMARIVRGQALSIKRREYVEAAHAMGVGGGGILRRHVVPNLLGPVVVYVTLLVPKVILLESFLSFLSLGVQEPMTSWGVLISQGQQNMQGAAYLLIFPSLFLITTLFALNFLGDGLRDALDPRDR